MWNLASVWSGYFKLTETLSSSTCLSHAHFMVISLQAVLKEPSSLADAVRGVDVLVAAQLNAHESESNSHPCQELIEKST